MACGTRAAAQSGQCLPFTIHSIPSPRRLQRRRRHHDRRRQHLHDRGWQGQRKDYIALAGMHRYHRYAQRGSGLALARQVQAAKAAGSTATQAALAREAGVDPATVSRLNTADKLREPRPATYEIRLRLDDSSPSLACMQEGLVVGETSNERNCKHSRNFRARQAVLRAAAVAEAARAAEAKRIEI